MASSDHIKTGYADPVIMTSVLCAAGPIVYAFTVPDAPTDRVLRRLVAEGFDPVMS